MSKLVHVAVGVVHNAQGKVLIARRPEHAHQGGLWEFPGGKVDKSETLAQSLVRELKEELNIVALEYERLIQIRHDYSDKSVLLDVYRVTRFTGEACGNEGQPIRWVSLNELLEYSFPAANLPIIRALLLPRRQLITGSFDSPQDFAARLDLSLSCYQLKLVQLRVADLSIEKHFEVIDGAVRLTNKHNAKLILNCSLASYQKVRSCFPSCDLGLHLNRYLLMDCHERPLPSLLWCGASCHNEAELKQAQRLNLDYVNLSPVKKTGSHLDAQPLGWNKFSSLVEGINIPTYGLGGLGDKDVAAAIAAGGQGVAGVSSWWAG